MNIVHCERRPKLERLEVVQKLRAYFEAMQTIGSVPERVALWPEQMNLLLGHGGAKKSRLIVPPPPARGALRLATLRIDGLPAVTLVEHIEIDERVSE